jgi:hypothetical protein
LLKSTAIYGANASGKSNLISAMFFFEKYIFDQFISKGKDENSNLQDLKNNFELEHFLLSNKSSDVTEFEIIFFYNGKQIQYGFECTPKNVINEWYYIDDKKIFERKNDKVSFGSNYQKILKSYIKVPEERLYMSVLEYFLSEEDKNEIIGDFIDFFVKDYNVYFEILFEASVKRTIGGVRIYKRLLDDKEFRAKVEKYLTQIDVGIIGLDVQTKTIFNEKTSKEEKKKIVKSVHNIYDDDGKIVNKKYFDLSQESTGTIRFLSYIQSIIEMTEKGGVFIVDEMSARLHPLLTKLIVDIFQSSKNKKAQLIFTTHDISLLNKEQFRRDEIIFVDKDFTGVSKLYALSNMKVREDATFNKDYLQGKYGAIPIFNYDEILGGENNG